MVKKVVFGKTSKDPIKVITEGGQEFSFNRNEYKAYQEQIKTDGGATNATQSDLSPNVKEAVRIDKANKTARDIQEGRVSVQTNQNQNSNPNTNFNPNQPNQNGIPLQSPQDKIIADQINRQVTPSSFDTLGLLDQNKAQDLATASSLSQGQVASGALIAKSVIGTAFDALDNLRAITSLGGKDTLDVKTSKENLDLAMKSIQQEIGLIPSGVVDKLEIIRAFEQYKTELAFLESTNKRKGIDNLAYWLVDGRNLSEEIAQRKRNLEILKADLLTALQQSQAIKQASTIQ